MTEDARPFDIRTASPLLVERRILEEDRGRRVERTEPHYQADRYGLEVQVDVESPALEGRRP